MMIGLSSSTAKRCAAAFSKLEHVVANLHDDDRQPDDEKQTQLKFSFCQADERAGPETDTDLAGLGSYDHNGSAAETIDTTGMSMSAINQSNIRQGALTPDDAAKC